MIAVTIHGGLGNQMFQYAFAYATAKKLNTTFYLDESVDCFKCSKYFQIKEAVWLTLARKIYQLKGMHYLLRGVKNRYYNSLSNSHQLATIHIEQQNPSEEELKKITNQASYSGFYQAEDYFIAQKASVIKQFTIRGYYQKMFAKIASTINTNQTLVCVHIRKLDYVLLGWDLPIAYYQEAIERVHHQNNHYVFISDEPSFVAENFAHIANKTISTNSEIIDFQFLVNSHINILSNSSFSWWGAYLNVKNALTIAPKNWLGKDVQYPYGITLKNWQLI